LVLFLGFAAGALLLLGWVRFRDVERVEVAQVLSSGGEGTNYLIVGSDSRTGVESDDPNVDALLGEPVSGQRADTILIMRSDDEGFRMLSIPRDTLVTIAGSGERNRVNSAYSQGPTTLVETVRNMGIPVHHYVEVDFVSFSGLVDAIGGVEIDFEYPSRDSRSGLVVENPGPNELGGSQALAYVRARYYEEFIDGDWRRDPSSDLGRVQRQQQFLSSVLNGIGSVRNPLALDSIAQASASGLRVDDSLGYLESLALAWRLRDFEAEPEELPLRNSRTAAGAAVLELEPGAEAVIERFAR